jgi:hypothetical protein
MLQLLHLDVSKADWVLYLSSPSIASSRCVLLSALVEHPYNVVAGSFQIGGAAPFPSCHSGARAPCGARKMECNARASGRGHPSERPSASTAAPQSTNIHVSQRRDNNL